MEQTGSCRRGGGKGEQWKEGAGTSQRTCMNHAWTWTMERRLTVGGWAGLGGGGKNGTTVIE